MGGSPPRLFENLEIGTIPITHPPHVTPPIGGGNRVPWDRSPQTHPRGNAGCSHCCSAVVRACACIVEYIEVCWFKTFVKADHALLVASQTMKHMQQQLACHRLSVWHDRQASAMVGLVGGKIRSMTEVEPPTAEDPESSPQCHSAE